jgi:hypothetical protein
MPGRSRGACLCMTSWGLKAEAIRSGEGLLAFMDLYPLFPSGAKNSSLIRSTPAALSTATGLANSKLRHRRIIYAVPPLYDMLIGPAP